MTFYRRKPNRLKGYDYNSAGFYFITICTANKFNFFGNVINDKMKLSIIGQYSQNKWLELPQHHEGIELDEFVVMPNHVHGIIIILDDNSTKAHTRKQLLSVVVGSYKSSVTKLARESESEFDFGWQKSYYDHIIRNEKTLINMREYIQNNPLKWSLDIENQKANIIDKDYYSKMIL